MPKVHCCDKIWNPGGSDSKSRGTDSPRALNHRVTEGHEGGKVGGMDKTGKVRGRIPKGHNRADINIGPKLIHTKMKDNRDLCLPWGSEYPPDTYRMWDPWVNSTSERCWGFS